MSSNSYEDVYPVCGETTLNINSDNRPFERVDTNCSNCGFYSYTNTGRSSLDDYISERRDYVENNENRDYTQEDRENDTKKYNSFNPSEFEDVY